MILLDENILEDQRSSLESWRVAVKQIGVDAGAKGMKDEQIIALLHRLRKVTFFTRDADYYRQSLCHLNYCLVMMKEPPEEAATSVFRFLRHPSFNTNLKRLGSVIQLSPSGLSVWRVGSHHRLHTLWTNPPR